MKLGKVWGETECLLSLPHIEIHRLSIRPYSRCSMHMHEHKWNLFFVLAGELDIEVEKQGYALTDTTHLRVRGITTVAPGEFHRFITGDQPAECLEIYYPELLSEDIVRRDVGSSAALGGINGQQAFRVIRNYGIDGPAVDNDQHAQLGADAPRASQAI